MKDNNFLNCRSWLFVPASNPKLLYNASIYKPDAIIFDLEDSVPFNEKEDARELLIEALKAINYGKISIFARVNGLKTPFGFDDIKYLIKAGLRNIRLPMIETADEILELDEFILKLECEFNIEKESINLAIALETPLSVFNSYSIANASSRIIGISLGAEDFTRCMGIERTEHEHELFYARSKIVLEAHVLGIACVDSIYTKIDDINGFYKQCQYIKSLGFTGKACIHPNQIPSVHKVYTPNSEDITYSLKVLEASKASNIENGGAILLDGKMIDIPVIEKAKKVISLARASGLLK